MDKKELSKKMGERIKNRRLELGLSQEELAKRMGNSSRASVSTVETGKEDLTTTRISKFAQALDVTPAYIMGWEEPPKITIETRSTPHYSQRIRVLGKVAAGTPIEMIEDVIDYEEMPLDAGGDYFGLIIHGDSMEPKISDGDVVIVKQQPYIDNGQIGIVTINGDDATCKRIYKYAESLVLMSTNPKYPPMEFSKEQVQSLPVRILGRVVELRAKF